MFAIEIAVFKDWIASSIGRRLRTNIQDSHATNETAVERDRLFQGANSFIKAPRHHQDSAKNGAGKVKQWIEFESATASCLGFIDASQGEDWEL